MTQILPEKFLDYSDILIKPKMGNNLNSRSDVNLIREFTFKRGQVRKGIPVFNANMSTVGNFATAKALLAAGMFANIHKFYTADEIIDFIKECDKEGISTENLFVSIGIKNLGDEFYKLKKLSEMPYGFPASPNICIDAPNFYIPNAMYVLQECRHLYPDAVIMCGNVASSDICQMLFKYADLIKIGIGSGSACLTRKQTGCGVPMVSLILECADVAHSVDGHICADGGIVDVGDISKAFCLNSDFVMIGGMFAGTDEAEGEIIEKKVLTDFLDENGERQVKINKYKEFYGMSSTLANNKFAGGMKDYKTSEGRELKIPYTGSISKIIQDIRGGIASACTYIGARSIKQMSKCATIIKVNNQLNKVFEKYE